MTSCLHIISILKAQGSPRKWPLEQMKLNENEIYSDTGALLATKPEATAIGIIERWPLEINLNAHDTSKCLIGDHRRPVSA